MGRFAKESGGTFQDAPPGNHVARCIRLVDLGLQKDEYQGKTSVREKLCITWELGNELMSDGRPFTISTFVTNSLAESAKLRAMLESWRGRAFTAQELAGFDLMNILDKPCMVNVVLNDKQRARVQSVGPLPKGMVCPPAHNTPCAYWIDEPDQKVFDGLPEGLRNMIMKAENFNQSAKGKPGPVDDMDDDIPF